MLLKTILKIRLKSSFYTLSILHFVAKTHSISARTSKIWAETVLKYFEDFSLKIVSNGGDAVMFHS